MVTPATMVGFITPVITAWLSDSLPRSGLPLEENERRLRNIALSVIAGFGVAAIVDQLAGGGGGPTPPTEKERIARAEMGVI